MAADSRVSSYAITIYPQSTDMAAFKARVKHLYTPNALSPLHCNDTYDEEDVTRYQERLKLGMVAPEEDVPEVGKKKKEHYHWVVSFGNVKKSARQVLELIRDVAPTVKWAEPVGNFRGYLRYLIHMDDPEKYQYDVNEIQAFCGCDLSPLWKINKQQSNSATFEILNYCRSYGLYNWCDIVDMVWLLGNPDLIEALQQNQYLIKSYCESLYAKHSGKMPSDVDINSLVRKIQEGHSPTGELKVVA